jgi:hypothetical protein
LAPCPRPHQLAKPCARRASDAGVEHTTGLPVEEVRRALRTLAMTGRASRAVCPMDERFIELWTAAKPRERTWRARDTGV